MLADTDRGLIMICPHVGVLFQFCKKKKKKLPLFPLNWTKNYPKYILFLFLFFINWNTS